MAEYPTRQFSASDAYSSYMQALEEEEKKKRAYNAVHHMYKLTNPRYAGSSAESSNLSKISKLGSGTSSGLATRLRLMTAADKENLGVEFTGAFQQALESGIFTSLAVYNTWANKQGPWYDEGLRRQHATTVKDMLDAQKSHKVSEAVSELYEKYAPAWGSRLVADQDRVIGEIEDDEVISSLPKKYRAEAIKQIHALLQGGIPATGQYAARDQELQEIAAAEATEKWDATQKKTALDKSRAMIADDIVEDAAACVLAGGDREECLQKAKDKQGLTYGNIVKQISEDVRKKFDAASPKPTKLQTETYWDPDLQEYVSATDQEARDQGLQPAKMGELAKPRKMDKLEAQVGREMVADPTSGFTQELWDYYREDMSRVDSVFRDRPQDVEVVLRWMQEVSDRRRKASTFGIDFNVLQSGGATGSGGIISVNPSD